MVKKGILLINLGTPQNFDPKSVKRYLKEFLNDPRVVDLPGVIRWPLVNVFIVPLRHKKTAAAYQQIWIEEGSPLMHYSRQIAETLAQQLGEEYEVALGMRYGTPTIKTALESLQHIESLTIIPLFPQYSSAATGSVLEMILAQLHKRKNIPALRIINEFYQHPAYINAFALRIHEYLGGNPVDALIFSYHGLPKRHLTKSQCRIKCKDKESCPAIGIDNLFCYRAQCYTTSKLLAEALQLPNDHYYVSFQSRLGKTPWVKPYTDHLLPKLYAKGLRHIAIVCPSFVADCLETLEEINIRARAQWIKLGGVSFTFIPSLNDGLFLTEILA